MLICCLLKYLCLQHCYKISSLRKNHHKTTTIMICETECREKNCCFFCYARNKTNSAAKLTLNTTNMIWKGATSHCKIGLPLNSLFYNCESNHHFATTMSFHYVSIALPSQVLPIIVARFFVSIASHN